MRGIQATLAVANLCTVRCASSPLTNVSASAVSSSEPSLNVRRAPAIEAKCSLRGAAWTRAQVPLEAQVLWCILRDVQPLQLKHLQGRLRGHRAEGHQHCGFALVDKSRWPRRCALRLQRAWASAKLLKEQATQIGERVDVGRAGGSSAGLAAVALRDPQEARDEPWSGLRRGSSWFVWYRASCRREERCGRAELRQELLQRLRIAVYATSSFDLLGVERQQRHHGFAGIIKRSTQLA